MKRCKVQGCRASNGKKERERESTGLCTDRFGRTITIARRGGVEGRLQRKGIRNGLKVALSVQGAK